MREIKTKCEVQISRIHGSDTHAVEIRLMDKESRIQFAEVHIPLEQFADVLFGRPIEAAIELRGLSKIGLHSENKTELVHCDPYNEADRHRALALYEVQGWKARRGDIDNHHNFSRGKGVNVVFFRHVGESYVEQEQKNERP